MQHNVTWVHLQLGGERKFEMAEFQFQQRCSRCVCEGIWQCCTPHPSINKPTTPASPWLPDITSQKITFIKVTSPHLHWMSLCIIGRLDYICDGEILCWRACYKTQEWDDLHATCEASDKPLKSEMDGLLNMNHLELSQRTADERSVSVWSTHLNSLWWYWFGISVLHIRSPQIYSTGNRWTM